MKKYVCLLIGMMFLLVACKSDTINMVKEGTIPFDETITLGDALDSYKYFKNSQWEVFETERGRTVVEFNADVKTYELSNVIVKNAHLKLQFLIKTNASEGEDPFELRYSEYTLLAEDQDSAHQMKKEFVLNIKQKIAVFSSIYSNEKIDF